MSQVFSSHSPSLSISCWLEVYQRRSDLSSSEHSVCLAKERWSLPNCYRYISKVAVRGCSERCSNLLQPNQLQFGIRLGAEATIHATRSFIESHRQNTILLKIDFTNAFNSIHRDKALEAASVHLPSLFNYVLSCYGTLSFLSYGDHLLLSEEGIQQGDPLGPLLFCLAIIPIFEHLSSPLNM